MWDAFVTLQTKVLRLEAGFGSYNLLEVLIVNNNDFYVPAELFLSRNEELELEGEGRRFILLKPHENRREHWIFRVSPDLQDRYFYNFSIQAYTIRNASSTVSFAAARRYHDYGLHEMKSYIENIKEEDSKEYSASIQLKCSPDKDVYYITETANINCSIRNSGNVALREISLCLDSDCAQIDLSIGASASYSFTRDLGQSGAETATVIARSSEISKAADVAYEVWDVPEVHIGSISHPAVVRLNDGFAIEFKVSPATQSMPQNVTVLLSTDTFEKQWALDELSEERKYILNIGPNSLSGIENKFTIAVSYQDMLGKRYKSEESFDISLNDVSMLQRLILFLNRVNVKLKYDMILAVVTVFVAGIVVGVIFRTKK
jgi:hypothetical protein